jgi:tellurite resistance protein TehA-like permease
VRADDVVTRHGPPVPSAVAGGVAAMHPASFAMVMATGIVSIACQLLGRSTIALALLPLNAVFYLVVWAATVVRFARYRDRFLADFTHHGRAAGFFTTVAATCVLGSQLLLVAGLRGAAEVCWIAGIVLWAVLTYAVFTALTVAAEKPSLAEGINGGWLLPVVAAQSVAVLGCQLASGYGEHAPAVLLFSLAMWLGGGMLYIWIISLIFYRYTFFVMNPGDLAPPYWINMGAVAISTLAGTLLALAEPLSPLLRELMPFIKGMTLLFWATATWWIPMLVILGAWRHLYRRFPLRYDPLYWGAVFPLGMYTVCTVRLANMIEEPRLLVVPQVFLYVALIAWVLAFAGLLRSFVKKAPAS